jgi:hypothetical protein
VFARTQGQREQLGGIGFGEELRFEIEAGRKIERGVAWAGVAIRAAVFAAAIGVYRLIEGDIGRIIFADNGLRDFVVDDGFRAWSYKRAGGTKPTIVHELRRARFEAPDGVERRAPAFLDK